MKKRSRTLYFRLMALICAIILPVVSAMLLSNLYAIGVVRSQVAISTRNAVSLYMSQIDERLRSVSLHILNLSVNNEDCIVLGSSGDPNARVLAKIRLTNLLNEYLLVSEPVDAMFYYNADRGLFTASYGDGIQYAERQRVRAFISRACGEKPGGAPARWRLAEIEGLYYVYFISAGNRGCLGAWLKLESLLSPLENSGTGLQGTVLFASADGVPLALGDMVRENDIELTGDFSENYLSGRNDSYIVVGRTSSEADLTLVSLIASKDILEGLPDMSRKIIFIYIFAMLSIVLLAAALKRSVIRPLLLLTDAMGGIAGGNLDAQIQHRANSGEFEAAFAGFNSMASEIRRLKINAYEDRLNIQRAELQYLQLQINPHFFINTVNIIYSLAAKGECGPIRELSVLLVSYLRCTMSKDMGFIRLGDEFDHTGVFLRIQKLRYPDRFTYAADCPKILENVKIPRLAILTFVENATKYGLSTEKVLEISVTAELATLGGDPGVLITVRDTGAGFPPEILEQMETGGQVRSERGEHIGIWNVRQRIRLQYGDAARLHIGNHPGGGALVELLIPLDTADGGEGA